MPRPRPLPLAGAVALTLAAALSIADEQHARSQVSAVAGPQGTAQSASHRGGITSGVVAGKTWPQARSQAIVTPKPPTTQAVGSRALTGNEDDPPADHRQ